MIVNGITGSNHCFKRSSDSSRRGEKRRTEAVQEPAAIDIGKDLPVTTRRTAGLRPSQAGAPCPELLLRKREAVGAAGVALIQPDRTGVIFEMFCAGLVAGLQQRLGREHQVV